jgi:hypothetical protein
VAKAKAAVRDFGTTAKSNVVEMSASVRAMEGNVANNERAVARFLEDTLHLGPALEAAFQVVGPVLAGVAIEETAAKAVKFFKDMEAAPGKIAIAFRELNAPLRVSNEELAVTNQRLENEIAKLEGRRQNTLALALLEAKAAADKLAESLDKDLKALSDLQEKQKVGFLQQLFGEAGTEDLKTEIDRFRGEVAGVWKMQGPGIDRAAIIQQMYEAEVTKLQGLAAAASVGKETTHYVGGFAPGVEVTRGVDTAARISQIEGIIEQLQGEQGKAAGEFTKTGLTAKDEALKATAETRKADQAELNRLSEEYWKAQDAGSQILSGDLSKWEQINGQEQEALDKLRANKEISEAARRTGEAVIGLTFNRQRINADVESIKQYFVAMGRDQEQWTKWNEAAGKNEQILYKDNEAVKEGNKILDEYGKALAKTLDELNRLTEAQDKLAVEHQSRMIALAPGAAANPVRTLELQQVPERAAIEAQYQTQIRLANEKVRAAQQEGNYQALVLAIEQRVTVDKEKQLAIDRLDNELAEKQAEVRQKGIKDIFLEAQGPAQSLGNIFYQGMNSAMDRVSDQLAKLLTGQKTSFGKMLQGIGEEMERSAIRSGIQRGVGALGKKLFPNLMPETKPDGSKGHAFHVIVDNAAGSGAAAKEPGVPGLPEAPAAGGVGSLLKSAGAGIAGLLAKIFGGGGGAAAGAGAESVTSSITYMQGGGPISAGSAYIVGDEGPELLTRTSGYIHSNSELRRTLGGGGGPTFQTTIDARGAEIGVEHRVRRMVDLAHRSAVATSVRAGYERSMRVPQRG